MRRVASQSAPLQHPEAENSAVKRRLRACDGRTRDSAKSQLLSDWTRAADEVGGGRGGQNPGMTESQWRKWEGGDVGRGRCMSLREGKAVGMRLGGIETPLLGDIVMAMNKPDRLGGGRGGGGG
jgi:hypothetical protein